MLEKNMQRIQLRWVENNINHRFKPEGYNDLFNYHKLSNWPFDYNAIIGWSDQDMFHGYIEGFYMAAEKLARNYQGEVDYLVYPVIFNYRQYLELALKKYYLYSKFISESQYQLGLRIIILINIW